jgi:beta-glucosidase
MNDFLWGVATAAYQIEGAVAEDGRGPSIWDTFSHTPGRVRSGDTGDVACDHYHRYADDIALMADLGVGAYRFSIAWPRVQPTGRGAPNPAGLDFYDRLVDALLAADIMPAATLFHWDLPQALEDTGGWQDRDTAHRFADYAGIAAERLGDRVGLWMTLNEPSVHTLLGHAYGTHAPGHALGASVFGVIHHLLLGHGLATAAVRDAVPGSRVGVVLNLAPVTPATPDGADRAAAHRFDLAHNLTFTDPVLRRAYPSDVDDVFADVSAVRDGDLAVIGTALDFLGVNYYAPARVRAGCEGPFGYETTAHAGVEHTGFGWPVVPAALTTLLVGLRERYGDALPPIYITENGAAYPDVPDPGDRVADLDRIRYVDGHLRAVRAAQRAGVDVRGYFLWSFLDNFEWAEGYDQRFGLVRVDFDTQRRTPKASFDWYREVISASPDEVQ